MEKRVFLIVLDSFGIGAEPDAAAFGDEGTNTLGAIAGHPDFNCPNLKSHLFSAYTYICVTSSYSTGNR